MLHADRDRRKVGFEIGTYLSAIDHESSRSVYQQTKEVQSEIARKAIRWQLDNLEQIGCFAENRHRLHAKAGSWAPMLLWNRGVHFAMESLPRIEVDFLLAFTS